MSYMGIPKQELPVPEKFFQDTNSALSMLTTKNRESSWDRPWIVLISMVASGQRNDS